MKAPQARLMASYSAPAARFLIALSCALLGTGMATVSVHARDGGRFTLASSDGQSAEAGIDSSVASGSTTGSFSVPGGGSAGASLSSSGWFSKDQSDIARYPVPLLQSTPQSNSSTDFAILNRVNTPFGSYTNKSFGVAVPMGGGMTAVMARPNLEDGHGPFGLTGSGYGLNGGPLYSPYGSTWGGSPYGNVYGGIGYGLGSTYWPGIGHGFGSYSPFGGLWRGGTLGGAYNWGAYPGSWSNTYSLGGGSFIRNAGTSIGIPGFGFQKSVSEVVINGSGSSTNTNPYSPDGAMTNGMGAGMGNGSVPETSHSGYYNSGGYYSQAPSSQPTYSPPVVPARTSTQPSGNYWGPSGNPFGKDLNKTPW